MSVLDRVLPTPRLVETDTVDLALPPARAYEVLRHLDLGDAIAVRALFALRELPRWRTDPEPLRLGLDSLDSTPEKPGFSILAEDAPHEVVIGAIGKVWHLEIPFHHVDDAAAFAAFARPDYVKVAWAIRVEPLGAADARVTIEVRVDATDAEAWTKFRRYFALIGPASRFIRRSLLASLARRFGTPTSKEGSRPLAGDELLADANAEITKGVTIAAPPEAIWPWLLQMGLGRAGFYAIDALDNGGHRSAREVHPELQDVRVGDVIPAAEDGSGFEVLRLERDKVLVLGGLWGPERQQPFGAPRGATYWHVTWAFVLEPLDPGHTRLHVRARAAFSIDAKWHAAWIRPVHALMESAQLEHLAARVEGRLAPSDWRDVASGIGGVGVMVAAFLSPFLRDARSRWGISADLANRRYPGDGLVPKPRWSWTHAIEIGATTEHVWPWIAQLGRDRGGFYSYQWLENIAGCELRNAESVHPELALHEGDGVSLHPDMPPIPVVALRRGRHLLLFAQADKAARSSGASWVEVSWLFFLEPLDDGRRCRLVSRYRCNCSDDLTTRLQYGATLMEPVGFAMDRRFLMGVKERAEKPPPSTLQSVHEMHAPGG